MTLPTCEPSTSNRVAPQSDSSIEEGIDSSAQALFKEARRRRRRRWALVLAAIVAIIGIVVGLRASLGGAPPRLSVGATGSGDGGASSAAVGHLVLRGNGIGTAYFGQVESVAIADLEEVLGPPPSAVPTPSNNCTIDAYLLWPTMIAYFDHQRFVGYPTRSSIGGPGFQEIPNVTTAAGLRIGNTLAQSRRIYGVALTTSLAQGGVWFASTPTGTLAGNLTHEVNESIPQPRISDVTAGSVGCPAMSP
jgi:hypothetical protein